MADELTTLLKDIANRDLLKQEIEVLEKKRIETLNSLQTEKNGYITQNNRLNNENSLLEKKIADEKKEIEKLEKLKPELELHCEKERKKINDTLEDIEKQKNDIKSKKDELNSMQSEVAGRIAIVYQREQATAEKESNQNVKTTELKNQEDKLLKLKAELETLRNESKFVEENARKTIAEADKIKGINQQEVQRIVGLLKEFDTKRIEVMKLESSTQEKVANSESKLKEITERENKIAQAVNNIENDKKQIEIDRKNLGIAKVELEIKERIVKEKLSTLGVK